MGDITDDPFSHPSRAALQSKLPKPNSALGGKSSTFVVDNPQLAGTTDPHLSGMFMAWGQHTTHATPNNHDAIISRENPRDHAWNEQSSGDTSNDTFNALHEQSL